MTADIHIQWRRHHVINHQRNPVLAQEGSHPAQIRGSKQGIARNLAKTPCQPLTIQKVFEPGLNRVQVMEEDCAVTEFLLQLECVHVRKA